MNLTYLCRASGFCTDVGGANMFILIILKPQAGVRCAEPGGLRGSSVHSRYGWAPSCPLPRVLKSGRFLAPLDPPLSPVRVPGGRGAGGKGAVGTFASWVWPGWLDGGRGCFRRDHQRALLPWSRSLAELR